VNDLSDSVAWPSRDPQWVSKVLLNGLILLIPIVGQLVVLGWMLTALDNLRAGRPFLPPASFAHLGRGVNLFVVYLVYALAMGVALAVLFGAGVVLTLTGSSGAAALGVALIVAGYGLVLVLTLALSLLGPVIIVATERGGIAGGLNVAGLVRLVRVDVEAALHAGLFGLVASLIGGLGAVACGVGQVFTAPYGYAVLAGVVHHYERHTLTSAA
jgi:uncharacterized protein DUF4013